MAERLPGQSSSTETTAPGEQPATTLPETAATDSRARRGAGMFVAVLVSVLTVLVVVAIVVTLFAGALFG